MRTLKRFLLFALLAAFISAGILAVMPHSHADSDSQRPHDCVICRAHSIHPIVRPLVSIDTAPLPAFEPAVSSESEFPVDIFTLAPESRAPPSFV